MIIVCEQRLQAGVLRAGEQVGAGTQQTLRPVERVTGQAPVTVQLLPGTASAPLQGLTCQVDTVEGGSTALAWASSWALVVLKPVNPFIATPSTASRHSRGVLGQPGPPGPARSGPGHVQQPCPAGALMHSS